MTRNSRGSDAPSSQQVNERDLQGGAERLGKLGLEKEVLIIGVAEDIYFRVSPLKIAEQKLSLPSMDHDGACFKLCRTLSDERILSRKAGYSYISSRPM